MKKILILFTLFFLTGCTKSYQCIINSNDNNLEYSDRIIVKYNNETMNYFKEEINIDKSNSDEVGINTYDTIKSSYKNFKKKDNFKIKIKDKNNKLKIKLSVNLNKNNNISYIGQFNTKLSSEEFINELKMRGYI